MAVPEHRRVSHLTASLSGDGSLLAVAHSGDGDAGPGETKEREPRPRIHLISTDRLADAGVLVLPRVKSQPPRIDLKGRGSDAARDEERNTPPTPDYCCSLGFRPGSAELVGGTRYGR